MGEEEMDEYISFCEGALIGRESRKKERRRVDDIKGKLCGEEQYSLFAGEEYKRWNEVEGEEYEIVIERGKMLLGVEAEYLNGIVRRMDIT